MNLKRKHFIILVCIIAILAISTFSISELLSNVDETQYELHAEQLFNKAKGEVEQIRGVTLPQVELEVVTRDWAIETWGKGYANPDLQNILREEKIYKGLFMIPENASLYQANVDWAGYFGAASWNGKVYVVKENFDPYKQPDATATFVHELTHILQGQFHMPTIPSTFDSGKAHDALTEGDASFMGDYYKNQTKAQANPIIATIDQVPWFLLGNSALEQLYPDLPATISDLNYFPYTYGTPFIDALYKKGGWTTVNQAYGNPPTTTEQILHSDKYFTNETAQQATSPTLAENDWTQVRNDRYGEYFIQVMLGNWLNESEAQKAAAGWAGDNFTYYERGNDYLFAWNIKWDSSCDASEFYVAFNNMLNAAGTEKENCTHWFASGRYLSITWNQDLNSTLVAASSNETAVLPSNCT